MDPVEHDMIAQKKRAENAAQMIGVVMTGTGALLMLFGLFCLTNLENTGKMLGLDSTSLTIVSWALMGAGLMDIIIAKFFMSKARKRF